MDLFGVLFYQPIYNFLVVLYNLLGQNLGLAIIFIAIIFRLVTIPLTLRQIKFAEQNRDMQEKINDLKKLHKNNQKKLQEEQLKLQQEYLPGQISGCLPIILQLIVLSQLNIVLTNIFNAANTIEILNKNNYSFVPHLVTKFNTTLLGIDISQSAGSIGYANITAVLPYILLALLVAVTQIASTKVMMGARKNKETEKPKVEKESKEKKEGEPEDFAEIMQRSTQQTMYLLPIMLGFFALNFPAGLSLYWTTQNGFVIIQQIIIEKLKKKENE
jgi:YidC/Oxa1 family membrane protein insertase